MPTCRHYKKQHLFLWNSSNISPGTLANYMDFSYIFLILHIISSREKYCLFQTAVLFTWLSLFPMWVRSTVPYTFRLGLVVRFSQPVINTQVIHWSQQNFGTDTWPTANRPRPNSGSLDELIAFAEASGKALIRAQKTKFPIPFLSGRSEGKELPQDARAM